MSGLARGLAIRVSMVLPELKFKHYLVACHGSLTQLCLGASSSMPL